MYNLIKHCGEVILQMSTKDTNDYLENGIKFSKKKINVGDEVTISYTGLLASCGADKVYAYVGYGDKWKDNEFYPMDNKKGVFKTKVKVLHPDTLNICFKDSIDNWDNNSSENYKFTVTQKKTTTTRKRTTSSTGKSLKDLDKTNKKTTKSKK